MKILETTHQPATARAPGRPRQFDHGAVLDAAVQLFWQNGYRDTSTRAHESALAISQSSIYNTFGSKQQLLEAAMDRYATDAASHLAEPLEASPHGLLALDEFLVALGAWLDRSDARGCLMINTMLEDGGETPAVTVRTDAYMQRVCEAMQGALERAAAAGELAPERVGTYASALGSMVLGLNVVARCNSDDGKLARALQAVRDIVRDWRET